MARLQDYYRRSSFGSTASGTGVAVLVPYGRSDGDNEAVAPDAETDTGFEQRRQQLLLRAREARIEWVDAGLQLPPPHVSKEDVLMALQQHQQRSSSRSHSRRRGGNRARLLSSRVSSVGDEADAGSDPVGPSAANTSAVDDDDGEEATTWVSSAKRRASRVFLEGHSISAYMASSPAVVGMLTFLETLPSALAVESDGVAGCRAGFSRYAAHVLGDEIAAALVPSLVIPPTPPLPPLPPPPQQQPVGAAELPVVSPSLRDRDRVRFMSDDGAVESSAASAGSGSSLPSSSPPRQRPAASTQSGGGASATDARSRLGVPTFAERLKHPAAYGVAELIRSFTTSFCARALVCFACVCRRAAASSCPIVPRVLLTSLLVWAVLQPPPTSDSLDDVDIDALDGDSDTEVAMGSAYGGSRRGPSSAPATSAEVVRAFLTRVEETLRCHPLWKSDPPEAWEESMDDMERFVMCKIYDHVCPPLCGVVVCR